MAQYRSIACSYPGGQVMIHLAQPLEGSERPVVAMLHGALRASALLTDWGDRLADLADLVLIDLPGHGGSTPSESATLPVLADIVAQVLDFVFVGRRMLLVGESVGGVIALTLGGRADLGPVRAVLALDPPMTTAKQWSTIENFRNYYRNRPEHAFAEVLGRDFFGVTREGVSERIYYPVLEALRAPTVIASGDIPLLPDRPMHGLATNVWDEVDSFVLATAYAGKAEFVQVANCGHLLLADAPDECLAMIKRLLAEHVCGPERPEPA